MNGSVCVCVCVCVGGRQSERGRTVMALEGGLNSECDSARVREKGRERVRERECESETVCVRERESGP